MGAVMERAVKGPNLINLHKVFWPSRGLANPGLEKQHHKPMEPPAKPYSLFETIKTALSVFLYYYQVTSLSYHKAWL